MSRKSITTNIIRKLWAQCGGFCQNPSCNKYLFAGVEDDVVSVANVAHIIGHGTNGPRSEHELANYIDKDGIANLIMLCLESVDRKCFSILQKDGFSRRFAP
jgi:hypothetical protein